MATNISKKKEGLRWGVGVGMFYTIYQIFLENNIFNGKNTFIEDIGLLLVSFLSPIILLYLFYWPQQKSTVINDQD